MSAPSNPVTPNGIEWPRKSPRAVLNFYRQQVAAGARGVWIIGAERSAEYPRTIRRRGWIPAVAVVGTNLREQLISTIQWCGYEYRTLDDLVHAAVEYCQPRVEEAYEYQIDFPPWAACEGAGPPPLGDDPEGWLEGLLPDEAGKVRELLDYAPRRLLLSGFADWTVELAELWPKGLDMDVDRERRVLLIDAQMAAWCDLPTMKRKVRSEAATADAGYRE